MCSSEANSLLSGIGPDDTGVAEAVCDADALNEGSRPAMSLLGAPKRLLAPFEDFFSFPIVVTV